MVEAGEECSLVVGGAGRVWFLGSEAWRVWSLLVVVGGAEDLESSSSALAVVEAGEECSLVVGGAGYPVNLESSCHCQVAL